MALADDLNGLNDQPMHQTKNYKDQAPGGGKAGPEDVSSVNDEILGGDDVSTKSSKRKERSLPKAGKKSDDSDDGVGIMSSGFFQNKLRLVLIGVGVILFIVLFIFAYQYFTRDKGADFMQGMEDGTDVAAFSYTMEERELLRNNGYTGMDIERYEVEERNPADLVSEAEAKRKEINDVELKPYLDGASEEFNTLKKFTWLGTGVMSPQVFTTDNTVYEQYYGIYNCDYTKVPAYGVQLFLRVELAEFNNQMIFMSVVPERYNELTESGNLVIDLRFNKYPDGSILVTDVKEKDIQG